MKSLIEMSNSELQATYLMYMDGDDNFTFNEIKTEWKRRDDIELKKNSVTNKRCGIRDDGIFIWIKYVKCKTCGTDFTEPPKPKCPNCDKCHGYDFEEFDLTLRKTVEVK